MPKEDTATLRAFYMLWACSVAVALVPALFPALDIAASGYFLKTNPTLKAGQWWWVDLINEHVPTLFRSIAVACLPLWWLTDRSQKFRHWARPVAFVGLALLVGPGLVVSGVKEITTRARPFHVTEFVGEKKFTPAFVVAHQCDDNCAFVSGHTSDGIFLATLMLIHRRRRWWWLAAGVVSGLLIGFARVSVGAHWLSDVLWAFPFTLLGSWLVYQYFERYYPPEPAPNGA